MTERLDYQPDVDAHFKKVVQTVAAPALNATEVGDDEETAETKLQWPYNAKARQLGVKPSTWVLQ